MNNEWSEQYLMMKRWFYRLQGLGGGVENILSMKDLYGCADAFWAFFISCHHLREYLKKAGYSDIDSYAENNEALRVCADVCNQVKHVELDKKGNFHIHENKTIKGRALLYGGDVLLDPDDSVPRFVIFSKFDVASDLKTYNAFQLACNCVDAWDGFLRKKKLIIPELHEEKIFMYFPKYGSSD